MLLDWIKSLFFIKPLHMPIYCASCGSEIKTQRDGIAFDTQTGKVLTERVVRKCPNYTCYEDDDNGCYFRVWTETKEADDA